MASLYGTLEKEMMCVCGNRFCYCATSPLQTKLWRTQMQLRKICKQSCTAFWKPMCVWTQKKPPDLWRSCVTNACLKKYSEHRRDFFLTHSVGKVPIVIHTYGWGNIFPCDALRNITQEDTYCSSCCYHGHAPNVSYSNCVDSHLVGNIVGAFVFLLAAIAYFG